MMDALGNAEFPASVTAKESTANAATMCLITQTMSRSKRVLSHMNCMDNTGICPFRAAIATCTMAGLSFTLKSPAQPLPCMNILLHEVTLNTLL